MKNTTAKERLKSKLKGIIPILALGLAYYIFFSLTGLGIPCIFNKIFDIYCPGCGISRMCIALLHGDIKAAARYNLFVLVFLIPALIFAAVRTYKYVRYSTTSYNRIEHILIILAAVCAIVFTILRNLPQFDFLAPI